MNWIPDNSRLSPTENLKSEHVNSNRPIHTATPDTTQTGLSCLVVSDGRCESGIFNSHIRQFTRQFPQYSNACAIIFIVGKIAEASVPRASRKNKFHPRGISAAPTSIPAIFLQLLSPFPRISRNWAVRSPPGRGGWSTSWLTVDRPSSSAVRRRRPRSSSSSWRGPAVCGRSRGRQACGTRG